MIRWVDWGAAAFSRARDERKPVLLSMTATWCHACHRMDDETWSDPGVAAAVERAAIAVRVDADARPDVYARFHLGGLPSTALLTADAQFVRGGTYLSPVQCLGFLDAALADWRAGRLPAPRPEPTRPAEPASRRASGDGRGSAMDGSPGARLVDEVVQRLRRRADLVHGGFGVAPKLPEPDAVTLLLRRGSASGDRALLHIARLTLDAIAEHLVDPDDGGFFRYGAAADWSGPHTEKLAVDQAALIRLYLEAAAALGEPRYADAARRAMDHARRRLLDARGRVLASVAAAPARDEQGEPRVDHRRFADAAAAMITAACAGAAAGLDLAVHRELLASAPDGEVPHEVDVGIDSGAARRIGGLLDDQALAIAAALDDHAATRAPGSLDFAGRAADWSLEHLLDETAGAFAGAPAPRPGDAALPPMFPITGNARMAMSLTRLAAAGRPELREVARRVVDALADRAARSPAGATLALAALALAPPAR